MGVGDAAEGPAVWTRHWRCEPSPWGVCPLCGSGELGSEHMMLSCPAVHLAMVGTVGLGACSAVMHGICPAMAAAFLHQVSLLALSFEGRGEMLAAAAAANALQCNVTLACHVCPEASIADRAEYCLPTGWRQQVRCLRRGVEVEVRFKPCKNVC